MPVTIESLTAELAAARARIEHLEHAMDVVGIFDPRFEERCRAAEARLGFYVGRGDFLMRLLHETKEKLNDAQVKMMQAQDEALDWRMRREPA